MEIPLGYRCPDSLWCGPADVGLERRRWILDRSWQPWWRRCRKWGHFPRALWPQYLFPYRRHRRDALVSTTTQQTHYVIMTSLLRKATSFWRNYVKMTSFWRHSDVIITSCVRWVLTRGGHHDHHNCSEIKAVHCEDDVQCNMYIEWSCQEII